MVKLTDKTPEEVVELVRDYANETFFKRYPHFKEKTAVIVVSSIAEGFYDAQSDVDVKLVFPIGLLEQHRQEFLDYEKELEAKEAKIQLILRDSFEGLNRLTELWDNDMLVNEMARGLIVEDPEGRMKDLQDRLKWYPPEVYREKVKWLFSHIIFQTEHFLVPAVAREDNFYCLITKARILEVLMGIGFLLNNQHPQAKKLYLYFQELPDEPKGLKKIVEDLLVESDGKKSIALAHKGRKLVEEELLKRGLIPKESDEYWLQRKANYTFNTFNVLLLPL